MAEEPRDVRMAVRQELRKRVAAIGHMMVQGQCADMDGYKEMVGVARGLRDASDIVDQLWKQWLHDDGDEEGDSDDDA